MMIDRAVTLFGLSVTLLLGLYTFAPPSWPKMPPLGTLGGMGFGLVIMGVGIGLVIADYRHLKREDFNIEFDPRDKRFVSFDQQKISYFIGLRNLSKKSIMWPSIRALDTEFTNQVLTEVSPQGSAPIPGAMNIFLSSVLDPDALEIIPLFDLPTDDRYFGHASLLSMRHFFTLARGARARCENANCEF